MLVSQVHAVVTPAMRGIITALPPLCNIMSPDPISHFPYFHLPTGLSVKEVRPLFAFPAHKRFEFLHIYRRHLFT
jgi:hypothetical protein